MKELRILVDDSNGRVTILTDGKQYDLPGIVIFAGDGFSGESFIFGHGSSTDAAFALAEGYSKRALNAFYKAVSCEMARRMDPRVFQTEGDPEEIAARWEKEDGGKIN